MMSEEQEFDLLNNEFEIIEDGEAELCIKCPLNRVCLKAFEGESGIVTKDTMKTARCWYELHGQYNKKRELFIKWQSFVDTDPKYFLEKMMVNYETLAEEAGKEYTFAKGMQLQYLLMAIHKLKFGERREINQNVVNASVDIKELMNKVRELPKD